MNSKGFKSSAEGAYSMFNKLKMTLPLGIGAALVLGFINSIYYGNPSLTQSTSATTPSSSTS